jgi:hypothetical protein
MKSRRELEGTRVLPELHLCELLLRVREHRTLGVGNFEREKLRGGFCSTRTLGPFQGTSQVANRPGEEAEFLQSVPLASMDASGPSLRRKKYPAVAGHFYLLRREVRSCALASRRAGTSSTACFFGFLLA